MCKTENNPDINHILARFHAQNLEYRKATEYYLKALEYLKMQKVIL